MERGEALPAWLSVMPLHDITQRYGENGLLRRFQHEAESRFGGMDLDQVETAYSFAERVHAEDSRVDEPYINHVLRVSTRLMTHYQVEDPDVVSAGLLHDSVEDHATDIVGYDAPDVRARALRVVARDFNGRVACLVDQVTNPIFDPNYDSKKQYLNHLSMLVDAEDPWPSVIKLADFTDNATGLAYTTDPTKVTRSAEKYLPAVPILFRALRRPDFPLNGDVISHIAHQLDATDQRLRDIVEQS